MPDPDSHAEPTIQRSASDSTARSVAVWTIIGYAAVLSLTVATVRITRHSPFMWVSQGIAFAAVWRADRRLLVSQVIAIAIATAVVFAIASGQPVVAGATGLTFAIQAAIGVGLLRFGTAGRPLLATGFDTVLFVLAITIAAAVTMPLLLVIEGPAPGTWFDRWLVGSATFAVGTFVAAPVVLLSYLPAAPPIRPVDWGVGLGIIAGIITVFAANPGAITAAPTPFLAWPPLLWATWRFRTRGAIVGTLLLALVTAAGWWVLLQPWSATMVLRTMSREIFIVVGGGTAMVLGAVLQERTGATELLRVRETQLRTILEHSPDGFILLDAAEKIRYINGAALAILEAESVEAASSRRPFALGPDRSRAEAARQAMSTNGRVEIECEIEGLRGTRRRVRSFAAVLKDERGQPAGTVEIIRDVSAEWRMLDESRQAQQRLRDLAAALEQARESERSRLSRELHDELGQSLTVLGLDVGWLRHRFREDAEAARRLAAIDQTLAETSDTVRRIATQLRPPLLDDLGLGAAVEWQARASASRAGLALDLTIPDEVFPIDRGRATAVFRILQEALTNVARHAGATAVRVELRVDPDNLLTLIVADDGSGVHAQAAGLGLLGMRERARAWSGTFEVSAVQGTGTEVRLALPLLEDTT